MITFWAKLEQEQGSRTG